MDSPSKLEREVGSYEDIPGAHWRDVERDWNKWIPVASVLNKHIPGFLKALEKWAGSEYYRNETGIEPIDLYRASGNLRTFSACSIIGYAFRLMKRENPEDIKKDLLKIGHFAGFIWEDLEESSD